MQPSIISPELLTKMLEQFLASAPDNPRLPCWV
jgi:hypothetical protein